MTATLITGASSGIGLELARVFAKHRHDLVLVARNEPKLGELAAEAQTSGVRAHVIAADLSAPGAVQALSERVRMLGVDVESRQQCATVCWGRSSDPADVELSMIRVNMSLTDHEAAAAGMVARRTDAFSISSTAALRPGR